MFSPPRSLDGVVRNDGVWRTNAGPDINIRANLADNVLKGKPSDLKPTVSTERPNNRLPA